MSCACSDIKQKTECLSDTQCDWDSDNEKCRNTCGRFVGTHEEKEAACVSDALCRWNDTTSQCLESCKLSYKSAAACNADAMCTWDTSAAMCGDACSRIDSRTKCEASMMCAPDLSGNCKPKCHLVYKTEDSCNADTMCLWDPSLLRCYTACQYVKSQDSCLTQATTCEWDEVKKTCRLKCETLVKQSFCETNPLCNWQARLDLAKDTSNKYVMTCRKRCGYAYSLATSCNADVNCLWDTKAGKCSKACGRYIAEEDTTTPPDEIEAQCLSHEECTVQGGICARSCSARFTSPQACAAADVCEWDLARGKCSARCDTLTSRVECSGLSSCQWRMTSGSTGNCTKPCKLLYVGTAAQSSCNNDVQCVWNSKTGECNKRCSYYEKMIEDPVQAAAACALDSLCVWNETYPEGQRCSMTCPGFQDETTCRSAPSQNCMWESVKQACAMSCTAIEDRTTCELYSTMCVWKLPSYEPCHYKCEIRWRTADPCNNDTDCMWSYNTAKCVKTCSNLANSEECSAQVQCEWRSGTPSRCYKRCNTVTTYAECTADETCQWNAHDQIVLQEVRFCLSD